MPEHADLLERFKPLLRYDSQEAFFADSAAMMTDAAGSSLRQGKQALFGGRGRPALSLDVLCAGDYGTDVSVDPTDCICLRSKKYRSDYSRFRSARPDLRNRIYGRAARGSDDRLWLQYWFAYVYNDYLLAARFGLHEGDWEMISLRIDEAAQQPDLAIYAQHAYADQRAWDDVVVEDGRPVVFVARGSHGSYFEPGTYLTEVFYDIADGARETPDVTLEVMEDGWSLWPGVWGATQPRWAAESPSPPAPVSHDQWAEPAKMLELAAKRPAAAGRVDSGDPGDELGAERFGRRLVVSFDGASAAALVATVNSKQEHDIAPRTFSYDIEGQARGRFVVGWGVTLEPSFAYEVTLSLVDTSGKPSATVTRQLPREEQPIRANLGGEIRLALQSVRDRVRALFRRRKPRSD